MVATTIRYFGPHKEICLEKRTDKFGRRMYVVRDATTTLSDGVSIAVFKSEELNSAWNQARFLGDRLEKQEMEREEEVEYGLR